MLDLQFGTMVRVKQSISRVAHVSLAAMVAAAGLASPGLAQDAEAPTPTPAPAPGRSIDFRLPPANDGRASGVQGPSDNGLPPLAPGERRGLPTPAPSPTPAPPRAPVVVPTQPEPAPSTTTPPPSADRSAVSRPAARGAPAPASSAAPPPTAPSIPDPAVPPPLETDLQPEAEPSRSVSDDEVLVEQPVPTNDGGATPWWAWMLAALAAVGAGLWYWRRRPALAGDAPVDEPAIAEKPVAPPQRAAAPPQAPSPEPTPARLAPPPRPASTLVTRPLAEQRAQVSLELEIRSIQILPDRVEIGFALTIANSGTLAATGMMIRIAAGQGSAMQEGVLARFFDGAGGSMLRDDMVIEPGASDSVSTEIALPRAAIEPLMIAGKPMLVPVMAFDITYHWDGPGDAFGQQAETFVLGRLGDATDKLAPLPLDRAKHKVERPAARATAMRRIQ